MNKYDNSAKFTIQKVVTEATFNLLQAIHSQQKPFEIVAHSGVGLSAGKGSYLSDIDKMVNIQIGLMPVYWITKNLNIVFDANYVINLAQNQGYDGHYVHEDVKRVIGSYLLLNIGLGIKFEF